MCIILLIWSRMKKKIMEINTFMSIFDIKWGPRDVHQLRWNFLHRIIWRNSKFLHLTRYQFQKFWFSTHRKDNAGNLTAQLQPHEYFAFGCLCFFHVYVRVYIYIHMYVCRSLGQGPLIEMPAYCYSKLLPIYP